MAIVGVGVDALDVTRLERALTRTPSLVSRLYTEAEQAACRMPDGAWRVRRLASRFAAKEAVAKALGTGVRGFAFRDVEVVTSEVGKPEARLLASAADVAAAMGVARVHLSLTTTAALAVAYAVAEG